jgi:hypothetical protein
MRLLKQSTATTLLLGPFVDDTDGKTAETALTISQADVQLWKEGGTTLAQKNESSSCTHRSNGYYTCPIDTIDTNTLGQLIVTVAEAGALPVRHDFTVVPANVYNSLVLDIAKLITAPQSNVKKNQALTAFMFVMTDSTNHAPATGKTVTCTRSIDGAAFGAGTLANVAEVANGIYKVDFGAGDLNGNVITLRATASLCDDTLITIVTQP